MSNFDLRQRYVRWWIASFNQACFLSDGTKMRVDLVRDGMQPSFTVEAVIDLIDYIANEETYPEKVQICNFSIGEIRVSSMEIDLRTLTARLDIHDPRKGILAFDLEAEFLRANRTMFTFEISPILIGG